MWLHSRVGRMCASCVDACAHWSLMHFWILFSFHFRRHSCRLIPRWIALQSVCSLPIIRPRSKLGAWISAFFSFSSSCSSFSITSVLFHQQNNCSPFYPPIHSTANAMHCETKLLYCYIKNCCADCSYFFLLSMFISFIFFFSSTFFRLLFNSIYNQNGMRVY